MLTTLRKLWKDEEGATAVEYGLMIAAIAAIIIILVFTIGQKVSSGFNKLASNTGW